MMKKTWFRFLLRGWLALTSMFVFIGGWAVLGHSAKPAADNLVMDNSAGQLAPLPTLAPLPELDNGSTIQMLPQQSPSVLFTQPRFRTRGS
jgi:hypothetical protein